MQLPFQLDAYFPPQEEYEPLVEKMGELADNVERLRDNGHRFSESELAQVCDLSDETMGSPRASLVLTGILVDLGALPSARSLLLNLMQLHGEHAPLLYALSRVESGMGERQKALGRLVRIVQSGVVNYQVFLEAAQLQHQSGDFHESIAMANLAVYENKDDSIEPFVLLAKNFHAISDMRKMLDCFQRIEKIGGADALKAAGPIYLAHRNMYENLKKISGQSP